MQFIFRDLFLDNDTYKVVVKVFCSQNVCLLINCGRTSSRRKCYVTFTETLVGSCPTDFFVFTKASNKVVRPLCVCSLLFHNLKYYKIITRRHISLTNTMHLFQMIENLYFSLNLSIRIICRHTCLNA